MAAYRHWLPVATDKNLIQKPEVGRGSVWYRAKKEGIGMKQTYTKPVVTVGEGISEGVYAASGDVLTNGNSAIACDSRYMNGVWQKPDYSDWAGTMRGYRQQFGCLGCPAYRDTGCGIAAGNDYDASGNAGSYDTDNGNRMPSWEAKGYGPDDPVTDWAM